MSDSCGLSKTQSKFWLAMRSPRVNFRFVDFSCDWDTRLCLSLALWLTSPAAAQWNCDGAATLCIYCIVFHQECDGDESVGAI